jgi:ketosteroid isomerase-like protein
MKIKSLAAICMLFVFHVSTVFAQIAEADSAVIKRVDELNRKIDKAVVAKDIATLEQSYGEDFIFTHGTGLIDSKKSWLEAVKKNAGYVSREHDSIQVELHKDIALVFGKLTVTRRQPAKDGTLKYSLHYVRVFVLRKKKWEMISHRTTSEWHHD